MKIEGFPARYFFLPRDTDLFTTSPKMLLLDSYVVFYFVSIFYLDRISIYYIL